MFTGLIEETGKIVSAIPRTGVIEFTIRAHKVMEDLKIDDSININGVCQTVVKRTSKTFTVQSVKETLRKTSFGSLRTGDKVNLERALLPSSRMGGHFVQGHVDGVGTVKSIKKQTGDWLLSITIPEVWMKYVIPMGSICIDGISLTVASVERNDVTLAIIPHTLKVTTLNDLKPGSSVNVELDMIGKYIIQLVERTGTHSPGGGVK
jgi:riboflavin synthase